jgi:type IV pilus assembly protein PilC
MQFICKVGAANGSVLVEVHEARDEESLRESLLQRGLHVFEVRRRGLPYWLKLPTFERAPKRIPPRALLIFNQELAALLRSGLPVLQGLELMVERQRDPIFKEVLTEVTASVKGGEELSNSFAAFGDLFPNLYAPTLKAGERSGDLERVIRRFIRYQRLVMDARRRVVSALVYPAVLISLSAGLIGVMTVYVMPKFKVFFGDLGADLPLPTRVTMAFSGFVQQNFFLLILALFFGGVVLRQWHRTARGARLVDRQILRVPLLGLILHRMALAEFCRALSTLLSGGLPVVSALGTSVAAVGNSFVRVSLEPIVQKVREGSSIHQALEESGVATDIAVDMVQVGETTGALGEMLSDVGDFLDEEVEVKLQRILSLLEPVMLIIMGLIVAALLTAVYLPLFGLLGEAGV